MEKELIFMKMEIGMRVTEHRIKKRDAAHFIIKSAENFTLANGFTLL